MASNTKEIKERIGSIKNSRQITSAMNVVSTTKFKKYQALTLKSRAYSKALDDAFENIIGSVSAKSHVLFSGKKEVKKVGLIVMTSDRGLCGSFNSNTLKKMEKYINRFSKKGVKVSVITIGKKARDYCSERGIFVDSEYTQLIPETMFEKAKTISEDIVNNYLEDKYDEVYLIYSKFVSVIQYDLLDEKILPFERDLEDKSYTYIFEPTEEDVLVEFIPKMLNIKLYQALLENTASEHSARMTAMKNASDNADDLIKKLTLQYNRVRQAKITQEINEIVAGATAQTGRD
ncbi:ATP synthase F1 subunit gamma [Oceanivirga miroungae]|uniref:ATP synthase gamma chain n=1 Tax=Oceanivirga miroungae TaxID=1130046 RepID=A0A6I8MBN3_9FUSO|nr:ATP synthase F1 subunit gamma [Oceanivirga miroungae]VWL84895.1 ATP synthase F1 subunit gamma [Oceanivirga miroungae]